MDVIVDVKLHAYGELKVLEDIRLHLHPGEIVSIIGPSGCGKSTLLGIMGGILKATEGSVYMEGQAPADCPQPVDLYLPGFCPAALADGGAERGAAARASPAVVGRARGPRQGRVERTKLDDFANALQNSSRAACASASASPARWWCGRRCC